MATTDKKRETWTDGRRKELEMLQQFLRSIDIAERLQMIDGKPVRYPFAKLTQSQTTKRKRRLNASPD